MRSSPVRTPTRVGPYCGLYFLIYARFGRISVTGFGRVSPSLLVKMLSSGDTCIDLASIPYQYIDGSGVSSLKLYASRDSVCTVGIARRAKTMHTCMTPC